MNKLILPAIGLITLFTCTISNANARTDWYGQIETEESIDLPERGEEQAHKKKHKHKHKYKHYHDDREWRKHHRDHYYDDDYYYDDRRNRDGFVIRLP